MPHFKPLQVLWLVGACLYTGAAPLGSLAQEKRCESEHTTEHLARSEKMCVSSYLQVPLFPRVAKPEQTRHEEMVAVTDPVFGFSRQVKLFRRSVKAYALNQFTDERSPEEKVKVNSVSVTPAQPVNMENDTEGHGNTELKYDVQKFGPFQLNTNRPTQKEVTLGHSKNTSLHYSDVEDRNKIAQRPSAEEDGERKVEKNKKKLSTGVNSEREKGISTEPQLVIPSSAGDSVSQPPWTVGSAVTAVTTSGSHDEQAGRSIVDKKRIADENLYTDTEIQNQAFVPGLLQPHLTLSSRLAKLGGAWAESVHLLGVEEVSDLPLSQEVGTEAIMSSEHLPLIFEPMDDATPASSLVQTTEPSISMVPTTGMLEEAEVEKTMSMDMDHTLHDVSLPGPSGWPLPWQMSGADTFNSAVPSTKPVNRQLSQEHQEQIGRLQNADVLPTSVGAVGLSALPEITTTQNVLLNKSAHSPMLKSDLEEFDSEENEDEEDEDMDESKEDDEEEDESEEEMTEPQEHSPTRPSYSLIPPPPVWGQKNQGLVRGWIELIREKAGYVSGMLAPVGIGIAGALFIVGALYGIRMIHRKRKNKIKHQRRKQPTEVRQGPDHAMLLADSSEDEL